MVRSLLHLYLCKSVVILVVVSTLLTFSTASVGASSSATTLSFKNFEIASVPGTTCPGEGGSQCTNGAAEPAIRGSKDGHFYASSENGLGAGTDAWRSDNGGLSYVALPSPNKASQAQDVPFAPGGGDTDLAVAPQENSQGNYNVYVASLNLANIEVSTSTDNGQIWSLNPTSATIPGDDREWIAADVVSKVCISYHDVATDNIDVNCSYDAGTTFTQLGDAIDMNHLYLLNVVGGNEIGNLMIDPNNHSIYQTFSGIDSGDVNACTTTMGPCNTHVVYMAVSTDGGKTFTDYVVYDNPDRTVSYGHQFVNVSIDKAGNVYSVYTDNHNVYYSYSTTHGQTWSAPHQVNRSPSNTAIFPWSVANYAGHLDIVWYGTSYYDGTNPPDSYPNSAAWYVYFAQSMNATSSGATFTQVKATPIIHYGGVCESGVSCTGNRDLYDDFGVAVYHHPGFANDGYASIVYSDDQYSTSPTSPPPAGCTVSTTNTASCDHTSIATQTKGPGI